MKISALIAISTSPLLAVPATAEKSRLRGLQSSSPTACQTTGTAFCGSRLAFCKNSGTSKSGFDCFCPSDGIAVNDPQSGEFVRCDSKSNPCVSDDPCSEFATCAQADASPGYTCECRVGYTGMGIGPNSCEDINECEDGTSTCSNTQTCVNTMGGFTCVGNTPSPTPVPTPSPTMLDVPSQSVSDVGMASLCPAGTFSNVFMTDDFESGSTTGWSNVILSSAYPQFSTFLGPYYANSPNPYRMYSFMSAGIPEVILEFTFIEGDSWDGNGKGGVDSAGLSIAGDMSDTLDFGFYHSSNSESNMNGTSASGAIKWMRTSTTIENSPQGVRAAKDQKHMFEIHIPQTYFFTSGMLAVTFTKTLVGAQDEWLGIDDVKLTRCVDQTPSMTPSGAPSSQPSARPSSSPTMVPSESLQPSSAPSP